MPKRKLADKVVQMHFFINAKHKTALDERARKEGFDSTSAYVRHLIARPEYAIAMERKYGPMD